MTYIKIKKEEGLFSSLLSIFFEIDRFLRLRWLEKGFENTAPSVNSDKEDAKYIDVVLAIHKNCLHLI